MERGKKQRKVLSFLLAAAVLLTAVFTPLIATDVSAAAGASSGYESIFSGSAAATNWGQAVSVLTTKNGGKFNAANIKSGGYFYVEYKGTQGKLELILQSWSGGSQWGKVTKSEEGTANGNYYAKFSYNNCVSAFGSNDFSGKLDQIHVGAMDVRVEVVSVSYNYGGSSSSGSSSSNNTSSNNNASSGNTSSNNSSSGSSNSGSNVTVVECENMTLSGTYAGKTSSPFNGVALYANNDSCSYTQYYAYNKHDFKLRGASNNSSTAAVDLKIGGVKVGTFYFSGNSATEYTLSNISHGTGNQKIELVVTTDNGSWDAFVDCFSYASAGSMGGSNNTGNSGSSNNNGGSNNTGNNTGNTNTGNATSSATVKIDDGYAMQRVQLMSANNNTLVTAPSSMGNVTAQTASSKSNQWVFVNNGSDRYMIVNAATGYVLAPQNNSATNGAYVTATGKTGATAQYWNITAANRDCNGDYLTYKITNCADSNLCLQLSGNYFILGNYKGSSTHRFYLNSYGAEGFAGKCVNMSGSTKASVTGGLLGKTVYVSDFNSLSSYCSGSTPYTIVITANISKSDLSKIYVGKNKTIIGSFGANSLNNVHFRCTSNSGNVIFKNITFNHDPNKNQNDDIQMYISNGNNFWVDHCTFAGHSTTKSSDVDKLMYVGLKADYVSVTGCIFMGHKYGLILGYPEEDGVGIYNGYPRMTICNNYFYNVLTRAPGLMRYGYFHCYNNFIYGFNLGYTPYTGANIYAEKNYFHKGDYKGAVVDDKGVGGYTEINSVVSSSISNLATGGTSFRPSNNYHYDTRNAYDAKTWCQQHAGAQSSAIVYAID